MSLEAKIELLTAAVIELTAAMQMKSAPQVVGPVVTDFTQTCIATAAPGLSFKAEEAPNAQPETQTRTTPTSSDSSNESEPVSYDDVKAVTIAVSKIDKAKAVAGLARFDAKNAKELKEEQWSAYVAYMKKIEAGEVDPESSHD